MSLKQTKKYRALITAGLSDSQALSVLGAADPHAEQVSGLVAAGFSADEAARIVSAQFATPAATLVKPTTDKDVADALVAEAGLAHAKGRVYLNGAIVEAAARVLKGGKPEIVQSSGVGRTTALVLFREPSGDVAAQNLYAP